ncbi:hypothetical protein [Streptosporangium sp. NPDC003464]
MESGVLRVARAGGVTGERAGGLAGDVIEGVADGVAEGAVEGVATADDGAAEGVAEGVSEDDETLCVMSGAGVGAGAAPNMLIMVIAPPPKVVSAIRSIRRVIGFKLCLPYGTCNLPGRTLGESLAGRPKV